MKPFVDCQLLMFIGVRDNIGFRIMQFVMNTIIRNKLQSGNA